MGLLYILLRENHQCFKLSFFNLKQALQMSRLHFLQKYLTCLAMLMMMMMMLMKRLMMMIMMTMLDLLRRRHVPGVNRFSRPTSLLFLFLLDCHRDRWQAPSVARLQGNRSWSSLNGLLLSKWRMRNSDDDMIEREDEPVCRQWVL